jgi:hypothetical protein
MAIDEIQQKLGTTKNKPVAVVLIGSPDETRSSALVDAEFERVPIDQVSSVTEFIERALQAARNSPEIDFVFRLHPRLAPNKRESLRSPDLDVIEELLSRRGTNVFLNSPGDGIGLYDVARIATFGINHASSAGLEFLALGIPVIHYDPPRLNAYPPSLGLGVSRNNDQAFMGAINFAVASPRSTDIAIRAWRWYAVVLVRAITHRSLEQPLQNQHRIPVNPSFPRLRSLVPKALRKKMSRRWAMRELKIQIEGGTNSQESDEWIYECIERIFHFDRTVIWNPIAIVRGEPMSTEKEFGEVGAAVSKLLMAAGDDRTD